ncbi:hypothetical protein KI387_000826, partial [Taxus chinensis]
RIRVGQKGMNQPGNQGKRTQPETGRSQAEKTDRAGREERTTQPGPVPLEPGHKTNSAMARTERSQPNRTRARPNKPDSSQAETELSPCRDQGRIQAHKTETANAARPRTETPASQGPKPTGTPAGRTHRGAGPEHDTK